MAHDSSRAATARGDGIVDTVGASPNAISLGQYPAYVNDAAATGARTFSMSDEAWNAMTQAEKWGSLVWRGDP